MIILSIETSCDETAISLLEATGAEDSPAFSVLGNALHSQIDTHAEYGGVFPMLAKREHAKNLVPLLGSAISQAMSGGKIKTSLKKLDAEKEDLIRTLLVRENDLGEQLVNFMKESKMPEIDFIAVTSGPGLEPALWVGISFAKALAIALDKPIVPVNHMEGHIVSVLLSGSGEEKAAADESDGFAAQVSLKSRVSFPALALLISGGHTELVLAQSWDSCKTVGQTVDDAIGEAFDKVARLLNLPYPGGPKISKLADESRKAGLAKKHADEGGSPAWTLPRPMIHSKDLNFSFSGIKTAVLYAVKKKLAERTELADTDAPPELAEDEKKMLAEEFENAVTEVLISKTRRALKETGAKSLIIGGGVIANSYIRSEFEKMIKNEFGPQDKFEPKSEFLTGESPVTLFTPSLDLSTDNSVMIGMAGYLRIISAQKSGTENEVLFDPSETARLAELRADGNMSF